MSLQAINLSKHPMYNKMSLHTPDWGTGYHSCVTAGTSARETKAITSMTVQADCRVLQKREHFACLSESQCSVEIDV